MEKSDKQSKKSAILISLMFLGLISPKAWGYAEKELPPSFSEDTFSSNNAFSSDETFSLSRAILTDEKGVGLCQVNLQENPQFLPQFAEPGSSETLQPLDLPECEEQSLGIVAQYAEQAWVQREVALAPTLALTISTGVLALAGGCVLGIITQLLNDEVNIVLPTSIGGTSGAFLSVPSASLVRGGWLKLTTVGVHAVVGAASGLACYGIADLVFYE